MNLTQLFQHIVKEVSGDAIYENTKTIWAANRTSNFSAYKRTSEYLTANLKEYGLEVETMELPFDGKTRFGDMVLPWGWNCEEASLELTQPQQRLLGNRDDAPNCVAMWSPPVEDMETETEVVCLSAGQAAELSAFDVEGKWILTPDHPRDVRKAALEHKAKGIITFHHPNPHAKDSVAWIFGNTETPGGWGLKAGETPLPILAIPPGEGEDLITVGESETLMVKVNIQSEIAETCLDTVHAVINGEPGEEEVMILVPLYDQGAHYNAAGVACAMETARLLNKYIEEGTFPKPLRTIRFVFTAKKYGTLAYAHQRKEQLANTICALYLESGMGNPDKAWCRWGLHFPPVCQRHFSEGLGWFIAREYLKNWRPQRFMEQRNFSLVGDVYFNDPSIGIPTQWLYGGTDEECRHSDLDTLDTIDRRSGIDLVTVCSTLLYTFASLGLENVPQLAYWNFHASQETLQNDIRLFMEKVEEVRTLQECNDLLGELQRHFALRLAMETRRIESILDLDENIKTMPEWDVAQEFLAMLKDQSESGKSAVRHHLEAKADQLNISIMRLEVPKTVIEDERVPVRTDKAIGAIMLDDIPYEEWSSPVRTSPRNNVPYILAWWLADGERKIGEIEQILKMEVPVYRECIPAWFTFLEKHGYVTFAGAEEQEAVVEEEEDSKEEEPTDTETTES